MPDGRVEHPAHTIARTAGEGSTIGDRLAAAAPPREGDAMSRSHRLAALALGAALAAVAACGGGASPTSAPTPTAATTPVPTPSPVAVANEFLARLLAARTGVLDVTGTMKVGTVDVPITGNLAISGQDSQSSFTLAIPGQTQTQTQDSIRVGTQEWKRSGSGPWVTDPKPADRSKSLSAFIATISALEDKGVAAKDGRQLHHLVPPASVTLSPDALGFTDPSIQDASVTMDFWAQDDGAPAIWSFAINWNQASGTATVPVALTMDLDLAGLGKTATVAAPPDPWTLFSSTRYGYEMAHPADWTVTEAADGDAYEVGGTPYAKVSPQPLPGATLDQLRSELIAVNEKQKLGKPETDEAIVLGGQPGRWLTYHFTNAKKVDVYLIDAIAMKGDTAWEVYFNEKAGSEASDTPVFKAMLSTFAFTK
jgi:hypothetical protein